MDISEANFYNVYGELVTRETLVQKMIDSFNARVDSIYKWFVKEMGATR